MQTWSSSRGEIKMDLSSGLGRPTHLPSHHGLFMTVVLQVFVPVTAAGQRGLFTPLPHIHLFCLFTAVQYNQDVPFLSRDKTWEGIAIPPLDGVSSLFQMDSDSMPEMAVTDFSGMSI